MALRPTSPLTPDPTSTTLPASITFDVDVVDRKAAQPTMRTLEIILSPSNDLVFAEGAKSVTQRKMVGAQPVTVTFASQRISGTGAGLSSFRVTFREQDGADLVFCMVGIE